MDDSKRPRPFAQGSQRPSLTPVASSRASAEETDSSVEEEGISLEELSQSYQRAVGQAAELSECPAEESTSSAVGESNSPTPTSQAVGEPEHPKPLESDEGEQAGGAGCPLTPQSITEAILFVGRSDGSPVRAAEIAALMRGVDESEVVESIAQLNGLYAATNRATRIVASGAGYRLQLAEDLGFIRNRFYGRIRQVKLNQAAIDCLALISYQPGISREELERQRGQASGSLLSQLIRRQLIEMRRETTETTPGDSSSGDKNLVGRKHVQRYYPTQRLLDLAGLESLDDLPQTEDID